MTQYLIEEATMLVLDSVDAREQLEAVEEQREQNELMERHARLREMAERQVRRA